MKKFTVGFIGTFSYWHGIDVFQYIIPQVLDKSDDIDFLLIGDGPLKKNIEDSFKDLKLQGRVIFTGLIEQSKAPEYLRQCDAFLSPTQPNKDGSPFFGSPTKLFEYMSMKKPVIVSALGQLKEIINPSIFMSSLNDNHTFNDKALGISVDALDYEGFIKAILWLQKLSQEKKNIIANNAYRKVIQEYTWKQHVKKIIDFAHMSE